MRVVNLSKYLLRRKNHIKNPRLSFKRFTNKEENFRHLQICIQLESYLIHSHNVIPKREWYIILDNEDHIIGVPTFEITLAQKSRKEKYRNPDIIWWNNGLWVLEVDGVVHHIKSANTEKRDNIYKNNNCKYIVLNTFEMSDKGKIINRKIEDMISELDSKIKTLLSDKVEDKK